MALYLGNDKVRININGVFYKLNLIQPALITKDIRLLTSDDYILQDKNGMYLLVNAEDKVITKLNTTNDNILKDSNDLYVLPKS